MVVVASIDIGYKNFCMYVEEFDEEILRKINIPTKTLRYKGDSTPTLKFERTLSDVYKTGNTLLLQNIDLTISGTSFQQICDEMFCVLDKNKEYWDLCDDILIERQMAHRGKINVTALKLAQNCYAYFVFNYRLAIDIHDFPAYNKTIILGAPKKKNKNGRYVSMNKSERKKWVVVETYKILALRDDKQTLKLISESRKQDDYSDAICQLQSYKIMRYL